MLCAHAGFFVQWTVPCAPVSGRGKPCCDHLYTTFKIYSRRYLQMDWRERLIKQTCFLSLQSLFIQCLHTARGMKGSYRWADRSSSESLVYWSGSCKLRPFLCTLPKHCSTFSVTCQSTSLQHFATPTTLNSVCSVQRGGTGTLGAPPIKKLLRHAPPPLPPVIAPLVPFSLICVCHCLVFLLLYSPVF